MGSIPLQHKASKDLFLLKYNAQGHLLWAEASGGDSDEFATNLAIDQANNCLITGLVTGKTTLGNQTLKAHKHDYNIFVAKFKK